VRGGSDAAAVSAEDADADAPLIVVLCTGNAARSVMAGAVLADAPVRVVTAGTHVVEGQPMSRRTRAALDAVGVGVQPHRSRQLTAADVESAALVVALSSEHVAWMRRTHPGAADKTATLRRLCRDLGDGPAPLADRVRSLELADVDVEAWEDVEDPAGGEDEDYVACAIQVRQLCLELAPRLG
jgi:protein-tyrosine-phosphatase